MDENKKKKLRTLIDKLKEDRHRSVGKPQITGVKQPKKVGPSKKRKEDSSAASNKRPRSTGPRGGQFHLTPGGEREYERKLKSVKKSLEDYFRQIEIIDAFIEKFKTFKGLM